MNAYVCSNCKTVHNYDDIDSVTACDGCKTEIKGKTYECGPCSDDNAYGDSEFCKGCVTLLSGDYYCATHLKPKQKAKDAALVVEKYVREFWEELGATIKGKFTADGNNTTFHAEFGAFSLEVDMSPLNKAGDMIEDYANGGDLAAIRYDVSGIKNYGSSSYKAGIHSHETTQIEVASAIIRSIRSKKSNLTIVKNQYWKKFSRSEKVTHNRKVRNLVALSESLSNKIIKIRAKVATQQQQQLVVSTPAMVTA